MHSADEGTRLLALEDAATPIDRLSGTSAFSEGAWHALDSRESINAFVRDGMAGVIDASSVLNTLIQIVDDWNFGFLRSYVPVKTPGRFRSKAEVNLLESEDPYLERCVASKLATLRELQSFYSTRDLFRMIDISANESLNNALASESASDEARAKAANSKR